MFDVTDSTFPEVVKSKIPVLVDFYAAWCQPCKAIAPHLDAIAKAFVGKLRVAKCDIDRSRVAAQKYDIRTVPTLLLFHNGQVVGQLVGEASLVRVESLICRFVVPRC